MVTRHNQFVGGLFYGRDRVLEPLYRPIRRILPDFGALDLAPLIVLLLVYFLRGQVQHQMLVSSLPVVV